MNLKKALQFLLLLLIVAVSITIVVEQHKSSRASGTVFPMSQAPRILGLSGSPLILRGANIESAFMYAHAWQNNSASVTKVLNPTVFHEMNANWHMNTVRICLSNWIYWSGSERLPFTAQPDCRASQSGGGLREILNLHDDDQAGSPYGSGADAPKPEASLSGRLSRLTTRAIRWSCLTYIMNPTTLTVTPGSMAVERRPVQPARQPQLLACSALVNAVRSTGARQIIVAGGLDLHYCGKKSMAWHCTSTTRISSTPSTRITKLHLELPPRGMPCGAISKALVPSTRGAQHSCEYNHYRPVPGRNHGRCGRADQTAF